MPLSKPHSRRRAAPDFVRALQVALLTAGSLLSAGAACAAPFAYVPNEKAGNVSVIDVANGRSNAVSVVDASALVKLTDITVGELPWGVAIGINGPRPR